MASGREQALSGGECLSSPPGKKKQVVTKEVQVAACKREEVPYRRDTQMWWLTPKGELRRDDLCLDYNTGGKVSILLRYFHSINLVTLYIK